MPRYGAFLRGINLGGRRLKNDRLVSCFEDLGLDEVAVFRASGNVIFETQRGSVATLTKRIESGLSEALGYEVPTFIRSADQIRAIAARDPFSAKQTSGSKGKLQVALLLRKPSASARKRVLACSSDRDRLAIFERELYWLPKGGTQESDLDLKLIADALGLMTMRTKGTIELISQKYFDDGR